MRRAKRDKYANFAELAASEREGIDFEIVVEVRENASVAVIAPHAGGIERGTGRIARRIADDDFSLYCFRALKKKGNRDLHITSHHFDEPRCLELIRGRRKVIAIHGCDNGGARVFLGGLDQRLIEEMVAALLRVGIKVETTGHRYKAISAENICNRGASRRGVQFELPRTFRNGSQIPIFVKAVRAVLLPGPSLGPYDQISK